MNFKLLELWNEEKLKRLTGNNDDTKSHEKLWPIVSMKMR